MGKKFTELIIKHDASVMDNLPEPYVFVTDGDSDRLAQVVNILATKKRYRIVSHSLDKYGKWSVCIKKEEEEENQEP